MKRFHDAVMVVNGLGARINTPPALKGDGVHQLPGHCPVIPHVVDEYPACPGEWMNGGSKASSYFMGVETGKGMWFDFTGNDGHTHHIAVVISVQGINPVTGEKTKVLQLRKHGSKCPVHDVDFQQDRFCPKCEYKWPAQNYIATTTGQKLWLDGFRKDDGQVRQYIITEEEMKGVASQMIGEDRVWAIGFAFYLSKEPKPAPPAPTISACCAGPAEPTGGGSLYDDVYGCDMDMDEAPSAEYSKSVNHLIRAAQMKSLTSYDQSEGMSSMGMSRGGLESKSVQCSVPQPPSTAKRMRQSTKPKKRTLGPSGQSATTAKTAPEKMLKQEIAAGAKIRQELGIDPNEMEFWADEPVGMIYVNYVQPEVAQKIVDAGRREDKTEGAFDGVKVGN